MRIVFFGTSTFAARILTCLIENQVDIAAVVTRVDKPKGRHLALSYPPVKEKVLECYPSLPVLQPLKASSSEFVATLKTYGADLFLVVAYGEILKPSILDLPRWGCVNIHASLLPQYRGAAPMQRALMDGVEEAGITLIAMNAQMDAGDVLAMDAIPVPQDMTLGELESALCALAAKMTLNCLQQIEQGTVQRLSQNHAQATLAPKLTPEEMKINWHQPASKIHNLVRALSPTPSAWCEISLGDQKKRLKIKRAQLDLSLSGTPGESVRLTPHEWIVACGAGALRILEVQLEGKKAMPVSLFLQGLQSLSSFTICT